MAADEGGSVVKAAISVAISRTLTSDALGAASRAVRDLPRRAARRPARVVYFHDPADPYSDLAAQMLPMLEARYRCVVAAHLVPPPDPAAAPDAARLAAWSARDGAMLAASHGLAAPSAMPQRDLAPAVIARLEDGLFAARAVADVAGSGDSAAGLAALMAKGAAKRAAAGHYLGATFLLNGEWFWGLDRLHYLERRLSGLQLDREPGRSPLAPVRDLRLTGRPGLAKGRVLHAFVSFRSPYSYLAMPRLIALARHTGCELRLRYVLPMVMRGLPVPRAKRRYILSDAKREATRLGMPFGRIVDPVGAGVERGLAVLQHAIASGAGEAFCLSFLQGVFADGIDAASDAGLRRIAACAGLDARAVRAALDDQSWRAMAEANRTEMLAKGIWGVPSFRVDQGPVVWGQDRLWVVENMLDDTSAG